MTVQSPAPAKRYPLRWRSVVTALFVLVLLSPVVRNGGDGVPLSSYPMYAVARADVIEFVVPVAIDLDGNAQPLATTTVAASNDPLVAESFLRQQVRSGRAEQLCQRIAARVDRAVVAMVEVRLESHEVVERTLGRNSLVSLDTITTCSP